MLGPMRNLIAVAYDDGETAEQVRKELFELTKEHVLIGVGLRPSGDPPRPIRCPKFAPKSPPKPLTFIGRPQRACRNPRDRRPPRLHALHTLRTGASRRARPPLRLRLSWRQPRVIRRRTVFAAERLPAASMARMTAR